MTTEFPWLPDPAKQASITQFLSQFPGGVLPTGWTIETAARHLQQFDPTNFPGDDPQAPFHSLSNSLANIYYLGFNLTSCYPPPA